MQQFKLSSEWYTATGKFSREPTQVWSAWREFDIVENVQGNKRFDAKVGQDIYE